MLLASAREVECPSTYQGYLPKCWEKNCVSYDSFETESTFPDYLDPTTRSRWNPSQPRGRARGGSRGARAGRGRQPGSGHRVRRGKVRDPDGGRDDSHQRRPLHRHLHRRQQRKWAWKHLSAKWLTRWGEREERSTHRTAKASTNSTWREACPPSWLSKVANIEEKREGPRVTRSEVDDLFVAVTKEISRN